MSACKHLWRSFRLRVERGGRSYYRGWYCGRCGEPGFGVPA